MIGFEDKPWSETKLTKEAKIGANAKAKIRKGQEFQTEIPVKICSVMNCAIDDNIEIIPDNVKEAE